MKKNNNGAALANVMLISAFVMIMATTIISIAFSNYRMKMINLNAKNNFYACEAILDEFRVDFRNKVVKSTKSTDADKFYDLFCEYALGGVKYTSGTPKGDKDPTIYDVKAIASLISIVNGQSISADKWTPVTINGVQYTHAYETTVNNVHVVVSATSDYLDTEDEMVGVYRQKVINKSNGQYNLTVSDKAVVFNNVTVTYEQNGYSNSISTDINVEFIGKKSNSYSLDSYSLLAYGGLYVYSEKNAGDSATLVVEGNMYLEQKTSSTNYNYALWAQEHPHGNNEFSLICTGEYIVINGNVKITDGAKVCFPNAVNVYVNGNISIDDNADSGLVVGPDTNIYVSGYNKRNINKDKIYALIKTKEGGYTLETYSDVSGNIIDYSDEIMDSDYNQVIEEAKKCQDGIEKGYAVSNFFGNTNMVDQNPADKLYVDIATGGTWRYKFWETGGVAGMGIYLGLMNDMAQYKNNIRALIISEDHFGIKPKKADTYDEFGTPINCIYFRPLGKEYYEKLLDVKLRTSAGEYTAREIFVDTEKKLGESKNIASGDTGSKRTLVINYSNWSKE